MSIERIPLANSGRETTRLGFGCSSLMGSMGRGESLRILDAAYDAGIRHFDVAPAYGYGEAEGCVGEFLAKHRGDVTVTTKYGIPPAMQSSWKATARNLARPLLKMVPGLKKKLAGVAGKAAGAPAPQSKFSVAEASASLDRSLRELKTDHIDVWLLHEVTAAELQEDALLHWMQTAVASGKIGTFGVGVDAHKIPALLDGKRDYCPVVQSEWSVFNANVARDFPAHRIHHRALTQNFRSLQERFAADETLANDAQREVGADLSDAEVLASLMLKASLQANPNSVILFSSKRPEHIAHNVSIVADQSLAATAARLHGFVQSRKKALLP